MIRILVIVIIVAAICVSHAAIAATLANHKYVPSRDASPGLPGNMQAGEAVGEAFTPTSYPVKIIGAQVLVAGGAAGLTFRLARDNGSVEPGVILATATRRATGDPSKMQSVEFADPPTVTSGSIRLEIETDADTAQGGITIGTDPATPGHRSLFCAGQPCAWAKSKDLGIRYAWIVGLIVETDEPKPEQKPEQKPSVPTVNAPPTVYPAAPSIEQGEDQPGCSVSRSGDPASMSWVVGIVLAGILARRRKTVDAAETVDAVKTAPLPFTISPVMIKRAEAALPLAIQQGRVPPGSTLADLMRLALKEAHYQFRYTQSLKGKQLAFGRYVGAVESDARRRAWLATPEGEASAWKALAEVRAIMDGVA